MRLLFADTVPSVPDFWNSLRADQGQEESLVNFDLSACSRIANKPADGGITALHMAALNGHAESVQLLLDLGADISTVTVQDGSTIDLIGAGSTPLHYAACGGNIQCCQILIARGASCSAENVNGNSRCSNHCHPRYAIDTHFLLPSEQGFRGVRFCALTIPLTARFLLLTGS